MSMIRGDARGETLLSATEVVRFGQTDSCEVATSRFPEMRASKYDGGALSPPAPDFPDGGESSPHLSALERPAVDSTGTAGNVEKDTVPGTRGEEAADRQVAAALGVAAGPGMDSGVGLVEVNAPGGGEEEGARRVSALILPRVDG